MDHFVGDTHIDHSNILRYCNRPFQNVAEMNAVLINNINRAVKKDDTLYHVGDFCFARKNLDKIREFRDQINCKNIILIMGNHDPYKFGKPDKFLYSVFSDVRELVQINSGNTKITLCHYALRVWNSSHHGAYHFFGHSHGTLPDDPNALSIDIGVDATAFRIASVHHSVVNESNKFDLLQPNDYRPITLDEINVIMAKKTFKPIDHHKN